MLKHENEVLIDFLKVDGLKIIQRNDYFNFSIDSVLLANFVTINRKTKLVLDLGTGNASIPLLLSKRTSAKITGIEIQNVSVDLALRNIEINNLSDQINIIEGDLNNIDKLVKHQIYDVVICNPPFFKYDGNPSQINNLDQLTIARHEITANLEDVIKSASYALRNRGYFALVHRTERLSDILEYMKKYNLEPKKLQFCHSKKDKPSKTLLIEAIKRGDGNLIVLPPIYTHDEDENYSKAMLDMFKMKYKSK